ncbi:hypothetical protein ScPMuIL_018516 [Solemya velum]
MPSSVSFVWTLLCYFKTLFDLLWGSTGWQIIQFLHSAINPYWESMITMTSSSDKAKWRSTIPTERLVGVPQYGWRVTLDYKCRTKCAPFTMPRFRQAIQLIGLSYRYFKQWLKWKREGRKPFIDHMNPVKHSPIYGCPIGGLGCGTIGRGYRGEFCRFQLVPGRYEHKVLEANQFIVCIRKKGQTLFQKVMTGQRGRHLKSWEWNTSLDNATYHALYPRAWTVYNIPEQKVRLICRQISPIFPHDYKDTSLPTAVFVWSVENLGSEEVDVSIVFTFKNGHGGEEDAEGGAWTEPFSSDQDDVQTRGVMIHQTIQEMKCTYGITGRQKESVHVSYQSSFDPKGSGRDVWEALHETGQLNSNSEPSSETRKGEEIATAVCLQTTVPPGENPDLEFCLCWDMPLVHFRANQYTYARRYTRWFGTKNDACLKLSNYALKNYPTWEEKIEAWQTPVLQASGLPDWYKSALFNELYYISDGGTVWLEQTESNNLMIHSESPAPPHTHAHVREYGRFAYLEGHEYRMYNTYDVHHYASFALATLWPSLQLSLQYDFAQTITREDRHPIHYCMEGVNGIRKTRNSVPHDIGDPEDEPWARINSYVIHPTYDWKDLNMKFVLQSYRDYVITGNKEYLADMYPLAKAVMDTAIQWDVDNDGIIENGGFADQTFDTWIMHGASAYCGGMWLAALKMMVEMGTLLEKNEDVAKYGEILDRGKVSYEKKLWNGKYYNYDSSTSGYHDSVMAGQLAGHWFLKASGLQDDTIFPPDHVNSALKTVYENNVMKFDGGNMGAINGTRPDGKKDISSCQAEEFWVGITYSVAASMIQEGLIDEGFQTAWGSYHVCWERLGLAFQTPEAYMTDQHYRALGYMRPLAIWAIQWAVEKFQPQLLKQL